MDLIGSVSVNGKYDVYYFYLGSVSCVPVYSSDAYEFNGEEYSVDMSFESLTSEKFAKKTAYIKENVTASGTESSVGRELKNTSEFGAEFGGELSGLTLKGSWKEKSETGTSTTDKTSSKWEEKITQSVEKTEEYLTQYKEGYKMSVVFSAEKGFRKGRVYRLSMMEKVGVIGFLMYDRTAQNENDKWSFSYDTYIESTQKTWKLESSESGEFNYDYKKDLVFDLERAILLASNSGDIKEYIDPYTIATFYENGEKAKGYVMYNDISGTPALLNDNEKYIIDWSKQQDNYDFKEASKKVENVNGYFDIQQGVKEVYLIGDPNKTITNFTISIVGTASGANNELTLYLKDFNATSTNGKGLIPGST